MMYGHWQSGTRKLNRHYQSGGEGSFLYTGMVRPLMGFEYSDYETYNDQINDPNFNSDDSDNVIVAPIYQIDIPTNHETKNERILMDQWKIDNNGWFSDQTGNERDLTVDVWHYGIFRGEPHFAYSNTSTPYMDWAAPTETDNDVNQNGIDKNNLTGALYYTYLQNTQYSFEDMYGQKEVNVVIPYYEILALPDYIGSGQSRNYGVIITPNGTFDDHYENKIRVTNLKRRANRVGNNANYPQSSLVYGNYGLYVPDTTDKFNIMNYYYSTTRMINESGALGRGLAFDGDVMCSFIARMDSSVDNGLIEAGIDFYGYYYALRLDHLKVEKHKIVDLLLPYNTDPLHY